MDSLFFHPKVVHFPVALAVLMPLVCAGVLFVQFRGWEPRRTWVVVVVFQAILLLSCAVALNSGENEEERVERVVPERYIEQHQSAAQQFTWGAGVVLVIALLPPFLSKPPARHWAEVLTLAGTVLVLWLGYRTGDAGGHLVYEHGAAAAYAKVPGKPPANREPDDDD